MLSVMAARAAAFDYKGNIEVKVIDFNSGTYLPITTAVVSVKVIGAATNCPSPTQTTDANGRAIFVGCPAYSTGVKKYKLVDVSAPGYVVRPNSNYKKATSGFYLFGKGRKKTRIRVYMQRAQAAQAPRPTRPPSNANDPWGASPNDNTPVACRAVLAPGIAPLAWATDAGYYANDAKGFNRMMDVL
ncbi:MAG TPA: hypothetical protein VF272_02890 [Candidatus Saccharimonadia bacterium]